MWKVTKTTLYLAALVALPGGPTWAAEESTCFGSTGSGRLENGQKLPESGINFIAYSSLGRALGRTYVHSDVRATLLDAWQALEKSLPDTVFVYGETGKCEGGLFDPQKTHQNGLSVDFMVPVRNEAGVSVALPTHLANKWGYKHEFDDTGRLGSLRIDFNAIAEHVYQLHLAARNRGGDIWRVIFAPELGAAEIPARQRSMAVS